jgi:hypothetical protein
MGSRLRVALVYNLEDNVVVAPDVPPYALDGDNSIETAPFLSMTVGL